jgi:histidinol-phosphate aminotransferase
MLILRTLSKAQGLAGLRFGYLIAHPSIIKAINRFRLPFNVSRAAQMIAIAALKDTEHLRQTINIVNKGKDYLYKMFGEMGLEWIPSDANFILVKIERKAGEIYKALLEKGVTVRPAFRLDNHIRITVGTENQNHKLIEALCDVLDISFPPYKV